MRPRDRPPDHTRERRSAGTERRDLENAGNGNTDTDSLIDGPAQRSAASAEIVDFSAAREALFWRNFDRDIRQRTRNRIRRLRAMLGALDYRLAAGDRNTQDVLDVGTLELCDLAGLWFPREMGSPGGPPLGYERHGSWAWKWGEG
jgi:hypothetical protein